MGVTRISYLLERTLHCATASTDRPAGFGSHREPPCPAPPRHYKSASPRIPKQPFTDRIVLAFKWAITALPFMPGISLKRRILLGALCLFLIGLVSAVGVAQAVHAHSEKSRTVRHSCSVCVTAHAGLGTETNQVSPMLVVAGETTALVESYGVFRSVETRFIRPPPAA